MTTASHSHPPLSEALAAQGFRHHEFRRNGAGHLVLVGEILGEEVDILLDTGASSTVMDLAWCRSRNVPLAETGNRGGGAGGTSLSIYALKDVRLTLDGQTLRGAGVYALDMSHVNSGLAKHGSEHIAGVLGADVLAEHRAVIDYGTNSLFLFDAS